MTVKRLLGLIATASLVAVVGLAIYGWSTGIRFYAVETGSMAPVIRQGDLVIDLPTTATSSYSTGEIITFHPTPGYTTTHRIVAVAMVGISTKGDANLTDDIGQVAPSNVVGRVLAVVPYGGYAAEFFRQPAGIAAFLLVIIVVYLGWSLVTGRKPAGPSSSGSPQGSDGVAGGSR